MPHVTPSQSSLPPLSGNVEDHPHPSQASTEIQWINLPPTSIYRNNSEDLPDQSVLLPHPGLLNKLKVLDRADVVEVNQRPNDLPAQSFNIHDEETSGDGAQERGQERSREEVIKEIAVSSTAFIGPACRPEAAIEKELSDFYKELEEIDHQDSVDGDAGITESVSQSYKPATNPSPQKKESREHEHKNAYRPYPATRPERDYGSSRAWKPQSHNEMTWNSSDANHHPSQWQRPPPRFPFHGPHHFFPTPPPGTPMQPPCLPPPIHDYSHADNTSWSSWEGTRFPLRYDNRLSASNCSESFERHGRSSADWQPYNTQHYHEQDQYQHNGGTSLVLMRGLPGCGKSTLAKEILSSGPNGLILSTDDYFFQKDGYFFNPTLLGDAHDWNQKRTREAMLDRRSPVIIDNTNVQAWEMKPYVALALEFGYRVEFVEPDTRWKCDPAELEKRNTHGVPRETIAKMLDRFELPISVDVVMNSCEPPRKSKERLSRPHGQRRFDNI